MKPKILLTTILSILLFASCSALRRTTFDPATHDEGVVINGVRWATRNVDMPGTFAPYPESPGMLFQWNRKKGWNATDRNAEDWDYSYATGIEWYAGNDPCPKNWRVPTKEEQQSLVYAGSEWITQNGVNGRLFGTEPNQIFLPATGWRGGFVGALNSTGTWGHYWNDTVRGRRHAWSLWFSSNDNYVNFNFSNPALGFSIRCVAK